MSVYKKCIEDIILVSSGKISEKEAMEVIRQFEAETLRQKIEGNPGSTEQKLLAALDRKTKQEELAALQEKRMAVFSEEAGKNLDDYLTRWEGKEVDGLAAFLLGTNKVVAGGREGVIQQKKAIFEKTMGELINSLESEKLLSIFNKSEFKREIAREMWKIGRTPEELANMPKSASKEFTRVAEIIHAAQRSLVDRANRAGAFIGDLPGFIVSQTHDMDLVRKAGKSLDREVNFKAWRDFIFDKLDWRRIEDQAGLGFDREGFLRGAWEGLSTGIHLQEVGEDALPHNVTSNEAGRVSHHRKLHFKDADSWMDYNDQFGKKDFSDGVMNGIAKMSSAIALMENLGPNPEHTFRSTIKRLQEKDRLAFDRSKLPWLEKAFNHVSGKDLAPANMSVARISTNIRMWNSWTALGSMLAACISDLGGTQTEAAYQGINPFHALQHQLVGLVRNTVEGDRKAIARRHGIGFETYLGEIHARFAGWNNVPGTWSQANNWFYKLTLAGWWTDVNKRSFALMQSHDLASIANQDFNALSDQKKRIFTMFDIKPHQWDALRKHVHTEGGNSYLPPDQVRSIPIEEIRHMMGLEKIATTERNIRQYVDKLETKFTNFYTDRTDFAVLTPDELTRLYLQQGTRAGTADGEFRRFVTQYLPFVTAFMHKTLGREITGRENAGGRIAGLAGVIAAQTFFGYAALTMADIAAGREPREVNWNTIQGAMVKGGGLGILTDFIFGEYFHGKNPIGSLTTGPVLGKFGSAISIYQKAKEDAENGRPATATPEMIRLMRSLVPGNNLLYLKGVIDYQVMYRLQEASNPGYLRRMEKRMEKKGQEFFVPPSQAVK